MQYQRYSSSDLSEMEQQVIQSEEESDVNDKIQDARQKRAKKLPARYRDDVQFQSERNHIEVEMKDSKFFAVNTTKSI